MQSNKPLLVIAVLVLIMNYVLMTKINDLDNQINVLSQNYHNLQANLNSVSGNMQNTLNHFTREQSWITPVLVDNEKSRMENEQLTAVLNWQIKDYQEGAEVLFHYRKSDSGDFIMLPPEKKGVGFFEISLPIKEKAEPAWELSVSEKEDSGTKNHIPRPAIEEKVDSMNQAIEFYISMKINDITKSSDISYLDLAYLTGTKYDPIQGHVDIKQNKCSISLYDNYSGSHNYESVTARFYDDGNLIEEKDVPVMQQTDNDMKIYSLIYDEGSKNISYVELVVKYTNGNTFKKVVK